MKAFLTRLGFRKMDEMERDIITRAQLYSYRFVIIVLAVWSIYNGWIARTGRAMLDQRPTWILLAACWIQTGTQLFLQRRAVSGDEEYKAPSLLSTLAPVVLLTLLLAALGAFLLVAGVMA